MLSPTSEKIVIQTGILRSTETDADLAIVVGHELAHNTMGHYDKKQINGLLGAVGGGAHRWRLFARRHFDRRRIFRTT